ncbi:TIR domain-containing protein [Algoriphagus ratkowskyi]|uniref:TIR domain-containing protein n=1 Tax=Algoriphagus ratkowskyi TaxID=57028 RepID=A0A2W7RAQ5_9BACT|nr:toll/interleukin-1 receptor domain-containing protein [Algoriphagus ratkowskyi]PZX52777.1 TIR domain-containing protein [Algoriphagus ratkowskyi]TXD76280.1 toll/interleukin-1 receptor domain-containing protein [Algoriphagus ratkowskyi]
MQKNKIFISYRQSDTQSEASRLKENLEDIFGADRVFFDIETLEPGLNFAKAIEKTLFQSAVVLVLIGETWIDVKDEEGNLRLFKEDDWVRKEVAMALAMEGTRVIPILVKDAKKLSAAQLPENIKSLADFHWAELTIPRWKSDVEKLAHTLEKIIPPLKKETEKRKSKPLPPAQKSWWARNYLWVLGVFVVLMIIIISSDDFQKGYQEGKNGTRESYDDPIDNSDGQSGPNLNLSEPNTLRDENPTGTDIIENLPLENNPAPIQPSQTGFDYSGKWWLWENGVRMGYILIKQNGNFFNFDYYYFDQKVGEGTGEYDGEYLYSTLFTIFEAGSNYGFSFGSNDGGKNWYGQTYNDNLPANAELKRN